MSLADLHERLGKAVSFGGKLHAGGRTHNAAGPSGLRGLEIERQVRPSHFKADDTPSIRALQADWDETGRLMGAARDRYLKHRNAKLYRVECRAIIERETHD